MKNLNLIPLNNDLDKLQAFIPSLSKNWRTNQRINSKEFQIETMDTLRYLQKDGWNVVGAREYRNPRTNQISDHVIKLEHPDFKIGGDAIANMTIGNSCNGTHPLELDLGAFRQVCTNGLIAHTSFSCDRLKHTKKDYNKLYEVLANTSHKISAVVDEFNKFLNVELDPEKAMDLAVQAAEIRFGKDVNFDPSQLLNIVRNEDKGNDLWSVYNRIQENLTQNDRLFNENGILIPGVRNFKDDTRINKQLFEAAYEFAA